LGEGGCSTADDVRLGLGDLASEHLLGAPAKSSWGSRHRGCARRGADADPRPDRLYFWFGDPIDATRFGTRHDDTTSARALRDEVKQAILVGTQFLRDQRDQDPSRDVLTRLRRRRH
jgi:hypothetical protein